MVFFKCCTIIKSALIGALDSIVKFLCQKLTFTYDSDFIRCFEVPYYYLDLFFHCNILNLWCFLFFLGPGLLHQKQHRHRKPDK